MDYIKSNSKEYARAVTKGVWSAITTPFKADGELDEEGLRGNLAYLIDDLKVDGIFCTGSMGEFWSLSREERYRSMAIVVEEARDKCLVNVHTGHHSARESVLLTNYAEHIGADFVSIATPYYPMRRSDEGVYQWFRYVCQQVEIGIWLFDGPFNGDKRYSMSPDLASRIADIDNICGMKVAWSLDEHRSYHRMLHDRVVLCNPREGLLLELMEEFGQQVHMSSAAPYKYQRPGHLPIRDYLQAATDGDFQRAAAISGSLNDVRAIDRKWIASVQGGPGGGPPIAYLKTWSSLMGMASGPVRPPLTPVPSGVRAAMRADLQKVGLL